MVEPTPGSVFNTVLLYSAFIIFGPIVTFFASKYYLFEGLFHSSELTSNVWAAILAVVVLHVALGLFIYKAYFEGGKSKLEEKVD